MDLISFLSLPFAKYVAVPVISTLVGTFFQYNCYSDRYNFKGRDLFYWAPGMLATTLLLICVEYSNKVALGNLTSEEKIVAGNQFYSAVILVICVYFIINTILRKKGRNVIEDKWNLWWGILLPDLICVVMLLFVLLIFG